MPAESSSLALCILLVAAIMMWADAQDLVSEANPFVPPCEQANNCNRLRPIECYTCTSPEYWEHPTLPIGGYPASAECKGKLSQCLYCWKQHEVITTKDGWSSEFQFKSCAPFPTTVDGNPEYANHVTDYCIATQIEKTTSTCNSFSWCTKTVTECQCNVQHCNTGVHTRIQFQQILTMLFSSAFVLLFSRKCCLPG
mmetsp:Transcript_39516/g.58148  ORF Transcript_39516/g.58148 Transcript_39516/m.58148 type:complete len:197 (+) Transcript_39516:54-644(+)